MPAPKVDPKKYADHMNRNKKPKKMTSTQKSLSDISKRANNEAYNEPQGQAKRMMSPLQKMRMDKEKRDRDRDGKLKPGVVKSKMKLSALRRKSLARESYGKEYQRHQQGLKDAQADMKAAKTNDQMVKAMNKKQFHAKAIQKMNRMESFACCGQCNCDPCTCEEINEKLGARSFQSPGNMIRDLGSRSSSSSDDHGSKKKTDSKSSTPSKPRSQAYWSKKQAANSAEAKAKAKEHDKYHAYHMQQHDKHMAKTTGVKGKIFGGKSRKAAAAHKAAADAHKKASDENAKVSKHWANLSAASSHEHKTGDKSKYKKVSNDFEKKGHSIHDGRRHSDAAHKLSHAAQKVSESVESQGTYISEKLSVGDGMGAWIDDFKKSDAPQFKGKDDKQRRDMAIAAYLSAKRGAKNEAKTVITKKMQQRALSKVRAQPKDKVSLAKAPWEKEKKEDTQKSADRKPENYIAPDGKMHVRMVPTKKQVRDEGYVSAAQRKAVWATRADGGKGHPDKKGKK